MSSRGAAPALLLAGLVAAGALSGCTRVRDVLRPSRSGTVDAHVVFLQREGCSALLVRTLRNGYTVLDPEPELAVEPSGVFEGPVRQGVSVFRYYTPGESREWGDAPQDVVADAVAVGLSLPDGRARLDDACGTPDEGLPGQDIPRRPDGL